MPSSSIGDPRHSSRLRLAAAVAIVLPTLLWAGTGLAQPTRNAKVDAGIALYDDLEFELAAAVLTKALKQAKLTRAQTQIDSGMI